MIPKKIHYCWFGGNPLPEDVKEYIASWRKYCPDYEIIEWNESNFDINCCAYVKEAYEAKKWAFVTDYVRLYALYHHGGIYMDTDVEVVKSLNDLLKSVSYSTNDVYDVPLLFKVLNIYISCVLMVSALFNMYYSRCNTIFKYIQRMALVVVLLSFIGTITNFMDGNFADRLMSIVPFLIALLVSDTLIGMERKNKN